MTRLFDWPLSGIIAVTSAVLLSFAGIAKSAETATIDKNDNSPLFKTSALDSYFDFKNRIYDDTGFSWSVNYSMEISRQ